MNRILIVDDEKSIQLLFADELTEEGYEVITTGDGSGLMGLIDKKRPDLVVLDIKLGENDGLDLLQDIRNTYYDLPVVMCTAYPDFKYDLKSIAADYYVVKSSDLGELKRKIKMAFESGEPFHSNTMINHLQQEAAPLQNTL
jgi:DNA-binding response OmpR family regulator